MTLEQREQLIERALERLNVSWRALLAARADMREVGFSEAAEATLTVLEPMSKLAAMIETRD